MTMRKKLLITIACLSVILCTLVTGTIAWLIADTQTITNTFTPSNITVELTESGTTDNKKAFQMIPGKTYDKDPKVAVTNDIDCYVFVEISETNNTWNGLAVVTYSVSDGWESLGEGVYYRVVTANAVTKTFSVIANDKVTINNTLNKEYMEGLGTDTNKYPTLSFAAYAIQSEHLEYGNATTELEKAQVAWNTLNAGN